MEIGILGPVTIATTTGNVPVPAMMVRATLSVLVLASGQVVAYDDLVDELWADAPLTNARNALQANIRRLRKLLQAKIPGRAGEEILRTASNGYFLDILPDQVDAYRFSDLAGRGSSLLEKQPDKAIGYLRQALSLWRGPALSDAGEGIRRQSAADRLNEWRITVREDLIAAQLAIGDERRTIAELKQLVTQHPERERLSQQLMVALYRSGRQTEALDVFRQTRQWLTRELGIEPSRALFQVQQAILTQDPCL